jgi:general stress protein CsbA
LPLLPRGLFVALLLILQLLALALACSPHQAVFLLGLDALSLALGIISTLALSVSAIRSGRVGFISALLAPHPDVLRLLLSEAYNA